MIPEDVELIQAIQPSKTLIPDGYIWHFTRSGHYTVKSGYRCLQAQTVECINNNGWGPGLEDLKAFAWKTRCPLKIQHFLWQMLSGCLPTTTGLNARGMSCNTLCAHCGSDAETINHIFFTCPAIVGLWTSFFGTLGGNSFPTGSVYTNMDFIFWRNPLLSQDKDKHEGFPWLLWFIWKARNQKVFQGIQIEIEDIRRNAETEFSAWKEAQESGITQAPVEIMERMEPTEIYCRTDGSWKQQEPTSGLGWVCLQGERNLLMVGAKCHRRSLSPLHSELEALLWAMHEIHSKGIQCHRFETDSMDLCNIINNPDEWPAFDTQLQEFHSLRDHYPEFKISIIPRAKNTQADCLARGARRLLQNVSYVHTHPPSWISNQEAF